MIKYLFLTIALLSIPFHATAATYYVATTGNDSTGDGSFGNPWLTPEHGAAALSAGDTLYIRAGTYDITTSNSPNQNAAIVPAAAGCTISGYPGETVTLRGNCGSGAGVAPTCGVIGSYNGSDSKANTTIANLTIQGVVVMFGTGIVLKNSDVSVGGDGWEGTTQGEVIWLSNCTGCYIQNNKLHDNTVQSVLNNNPLIIAYDSHSCVIERNNIYNSAGPGINLKDMSDHHIVRYNYIYNNAGSGVWTANQDTSSGTQIYQNVISGNNTGADEASGGVTITIATTDTLIYNNTFYNNSVSDLMKWDDSTSATFHFFNNISHSPVNYHVLFPYAGTVLQGSMLYCDYNTYYNDVSWKYRSTTYSTIADWKTGCQALLTGCDEHAITTDPGFINASTSYSVVTDFKRSTYTANGRGGSYPSVMGAYITGNECIGYGCSPVAATGVSISGGSIQ